MSYGTLLFEDWNAAPDTGVLYRLELQKLDYSGASRRVNLRDKYMDHNYQTLNIREPFKNTLLKSDLTMMLSMELDADVALLEEIFSSGPKDYRIVKYVDGEIEWMGLVDTSQIEYPRSPGPIQGNIKSRDLDELTGEDYGLQSGRVRIIKVIADILSTLDYELPIRSYTSWKEGAMTNDQDFLYERYIDTFALRAYGRGPGEPDESITKYEALERVLKPFKLFIIQSEGHWNLFQLTALMESDAITEFEYTKDGDLLVPPQPDPPTNFDVEILEVS